MHRRLQPDLGRDSPAQEGNLIILKQHMNTCVADAIKAKDGSEKIDEISMILEKYIG